MHARAPSLMPNQSRRVHSDCTTIQPGSRGTVPNGCESLSTKSIVLAGATKQFAGGVRPAVWNVSFDVEPGEIVALLGPSGCGKTTTLRLIAGFERLDAGSISINGRVM